MLACFLNLGSASLQHGQENILTFHLSALLLAQGHLRIPQHRPQDIEDLGVSKGFAVTAQISECIRAAQVLSPIHVLLYQSPFQF